MKTLFFIKLGGALITDKQREKVFHPQVVADLVAQVATVRQHRPDIQFIIGHGQGGYGHVSARTYETGAGFQDERGKLGVSLVLNDVIELHHLVTAQFVAQQLPVVSWRAQEQIFLSNQQVVTNWQHLDFLLSQQFIPLTCGDVIMSQKQGCTIWSTETILTHIATQHPTLSQTNHLAGMIHLTAEAGFLDGKQQVVPEITLATWPQLQQSLFPTQGHDVTGGMALKIQESLRLAAAGIPSWVVAGTRPQVLTDLILEGQAIGTHIH